MCGIAGVSLSPTENVNSTTLARELLLSIQERGRHATGVAWADESGQAWIVKGAQAATDFVTGSHVPVEARSFISHTRWATQGSVNNNDNNHPIDVAGIVGIHNGCISNDDELFDLIGADKRRAEVDSEAIFATLLHSGMSVGDSLELVRGSAAVSWYNLEDTTTLHLARVSSSPLIFGHTEGGSFFFASTEKAIRRAALATGLSITHLYATPEGYYYQIRDGAIVATEQFSKQGHRSLSSIERQALNVA